MEGRREGGVEKGGECGQEEMRGWEGEEKRSEEKSRDEKRSEERREGGKGTGEER
jgi:hypothetical protein